MIVDGLLLIESIDYDVVGDIYTPIKLCNIVNLTLETSIPSWTTIQTLQARVCSVMFLCEYLAQNQFEIKDRHVYLNYNLTYLNNVANCNNDKLIVSQKFVDQPNPKLHYSLWIIAKVCKILDVDSKDDYFSYQQ